MQRGWTVVAVALVAASSSTGCSASGSTGRSTATRRTAPANLRTSGAASIGDPYFPESGNGGYDVGHYDLKIAYTPAQTAIQATATITSTATKDLGAFNLDFVGLHIDAITVDGITATFRRTGPELTIRPKRTLTTGRRFITRVAYHGTPETVPDPSESAPANASKLGWTRTADGSVYVVSEPVGARTWFPSNDHPADKATFAIAVDVPQNVAVASNGTLVQGPVTHGRRTWRWNMHQPMATYLATVVIAPMREQQAASPAGVPVRNFFPDPLYADAVKDYAKTGAMIDYFVSIFGPYPFDAYGVVVVPQDLGYALETQTMSLFGRDMLGTDMNSETTFAHELAHQWFGDSVSIKRWADIWLNEGFATYAQFLWQAHADPKFDLNTAMANMRAEDEGALTRPHDPGPDRLFTRAIYERGALVVHALRRTIGDDKFFAVLKTWAAKYRYSIATTADFIALTNSVAGRDLTDFFHRWLDTDRVPPLP